jgi:hypothetical protein
MVRAARFSALRRELLHMPAPLLLQQQPGPPWILEPTPMAVD